MRTRETYWFAKRSLLLLAIMDTGFSTIRTVKRRGFMDVAETEAVRL
jgi:hypothetical protein